MSTVEGRRSPVQRQLEAYRESWQEDHDAALACRDWEESIAVGIHVFRLLQQREQHWRAQVRRGLLPYSPEDDHDQQLRLMEWLDTTGPILAEKLPALELAYGTVAGAEELRACARLCQEHLRHWQPPHLSLADAHDVGDEGLASANADAQAPPEFVWSKSRYQARKAAQEFSKETHADY